MPEIYIQYYNILFFGYGLSIFLYGLASNKLKPKIAGFVFCAVNLNSPGLQSFFDNILGFGVAVPGLVLLCVMIILMRPGISFPRDIFFNKITLFLLPILISLVFLSALKSTQPVETIKNILSLILVITGGWFLISRLISPFSGIDPRYVMITVLHYVGVAAFILITSLIIIAGPLSFNRMIGGQESLINFFGLSLSRLQLDGFNATGVGATSAFGLFWAYWRFEFAKYTSMKIISLILMLVFLISLLWSGSRGALAACILTVIFLNLLDINKNYSTLKKSIKFIFITLPIISIIGFFLFANLQRGSAASDSISIIELFMFGRILNEGPLFMDLFFSAGLFGHGYGSLAMSQGTERLSVESYWPRVFIELGFLGSLLYTLFFLYFAVLIARSDRWYQKEAKGWPYLPTAFIMLIWANSITSWGFSSPNASLMIAFVVFTCSYFGLIRSRKY